MYQVQLKEINDRKNDTLLEEKRPKKRKNAALAYFDKKLFLIGGKVNNYACKSVWIFDLKSCSWSRSEMETFPLLEHHSVYVDEKGIYIFGGQFKNSSSAIYLVQILDVDRMRLSVPSGYNVPNYKQHSIVNFNDCVYVFGGWNETLGISSNITRFDPKSGIPCIVKCASKVVPSPRYGHSAIVYSSSMFIIGGMDNNLTCCSDIWMFNFVSSCWEEIKPASVRLAIYAHCAVLYNAHIVVTGGKLADDSINEDCWIFSLRNRTWTNLGCLMTPSGLKFHVTNMISISSQNHRNSSIINKSIEQLSSSAVNYGYIHQDPLSFWTKLKTCALTTAAKSTTIVGQEKVKLANIAIKTMSSPQILSVQSLEMLNRKDFYTSRTKTSEEIFVLGTMEDSDYYSVFFLNLFCKFL